MASETSPFDELKGTLSTINSYISWSKLAIFCGFLLAGYFGAHLASAWALTNLAEVTTSSFLINAISYLALIPGMILGAGIYTQILKLHSIWPTDEFSHEELNLRVFWSDLKETARGFDLGLLTFLGQVAFGIPNINIPEADPNTNWFSRKFHNGLKWVADSAHSAAKNYAAPVGMRTSLTTGIHMMHYEVVNIDVLNNMQHEQAQAHRDAEVLSFAGSSLITGLMPTRAGFFETIGQAVKYECETPVKKLGAQI